MANYSFKYIKTKGGEYIKALVTDTLDGTYLSVENTDTAQAMKAECTAIVPSEDLPLYFSDDVYISDHMNTTDYHLPWYVCPSATYFSETVSHTATEYILLIYGQTYLTLYQKQDGYYLKTSGTYAPEFIASLEMVDELPNPMVKMWAMCGFRMGQQLRDNGVKPWEPWLKSYAIYSADDNSLVFYKNYDYWSAASGGTYNGKTVTGIYTGFETEEYSAQADLPWNDIVADILTVSFADVIKPRSTLRWFSLCSALTKIENIENLDTSNVTSMRAMFQNCASLTELDVSGFDTSNVTAMNHMFRSCSALTELDLSSLNTSNVTDMREMFYKCTSLTKLDISSFDTSNVTAMNHMFYDCTALPGFDIGGFNTSNVTTMRCMFFNCSALTELDLSSFNTSKVTDMAAMFRGCSALASLNVSNFNTGNVTTMSSMFWNCQNLSALALDSFNTSKVTAMDYMFGNCYALTSLDLSSFDTTNVTTMQSMFNYCNALTSLDVSSFDTSNVTSIGWMFQNCPVECLDLSSFNTEKVATVTRMFYGCTSLSTIYVSDLWSMGAVTDSTNMFYSCESLVGGNGTVFNSSYVDATYAVIDTADTPGYLTLKSS